MTLNFFHKCTTITPRCLFSLALICALVFGLGSQIYSVSQQQAIDILFTAEDDQPSVLIDKILQQSVKHLPESHVQVDEHHDDEHQDQSPGQNFQKEPITIIPTQPTPNYNVSSLLDKYLYFSDDTSSTASSFSQTSSIYNCGRFWLYRNMQLLLSITSITNSRITIANVNPNIKNCDASRLTIYVRVIGVEIIGDSAKANDTHCEWYFDFVISISDWYIIDARLLDLDGNMEFNYNKCHFQENKILYNKQTTFFDTKGIYHDTKFINVQINYKKFYKSSEQCCEWCTRQGINKCKYFIASNTFEHFLYPNRCIMFANINITVDENNSAKNIRVDSVQNAMLSRVNIEKREMDLIDSSLLVYGSSNISYLIEEKDVREAFNRQTWYFGENRQEKTTYYLGSRATTTPTNSICRDTSFDLIHGKTKVNLTIKHIDIDINNNGGYSKKVMKNCSMMDNFKYNSMQGRWIDKGKFISMFFSKYENNINFNRNSNVSDDDINGWFSYETNSYHTFDKTFLSNSESVFSYQFIFVPYYCSMRYIPIEKSISYLFQRQNYKIIIINGDSIMANFVKRMIDSISNKIDIVDAKQAYVNPNDCDIICQIKNTLFVDESVYNEYKIPLIIKRMSFDHFGWMLKHNNMSNVLINNINLLIENFENIHSVWHKNKTEIEKYFRNSAQSYDNQFNRYFGSDKNVWPLRIVFELPLMVSEREYHCTALRGIMANQLIHEIFEIEYGWKVFPLFEISKAMQYDHTAVKDGLHPSGSVLDEIIRIFFEMLVDKEY